MRQFMWQSRRAWDLFAGQSRLLTGFDANADGEIDGDDGAYETESDEEIDDDGEYDALLKLSEVDSTKGICYENYSWLGEERFEGQILGKRTRSS